MKYQKGFEFTKDTNKKISKTQHLSVN